MVRKRSGEMAKLEADPVFWAARQARLKKLTTTVELDLKRQQSTKYKAPTRACAICGKQHNGSNGKRCWQCRRDGKQIERK